MNLGCDGETPNHLSSRFPDVTDAPTGEGDVSRSEVTESARHCVECLESIPVVAQKCPECGASQRPSSVGPRAIKLASVVVALISFVLGMHQLTDMAISRIARGSTLETKLGVAQALIDQREYGAAWALLESTHDSPETSEMRVRVARHWLLDASSLASGMSLGELAKQLSPVLAPGTRSDDPRHRADHQALLAYAQLLRARDEPVASDVRALYQAALWEEDTSALAHMLFGHYLLSYEAEMGLGLEHLARAAQLSADDEATRAMVRRWQLAALTNVLRSARRGRDEPTESNPTWLARIALVQLADELRTSGEAVPAGAASASMDGLRSDRYLKQLTAAYQLRSAQAIAQLGRALPAQQHVALLEWLQSERGDQARPSAEAYLAALLHEDLGDSKAAVAVLLSSPPDYRLRSAYDELQQRLTGEPYGPLSERDPWAYRAGVLRRAEPGSRELREVSEKVDEYMLWHRMGGRVHDAVALQAVKSRREARAERSPGEASPDANERELDRKHALYEGELLLAAGRAVDAAAVLRELVDQLEPGHAERGRALVELAAARLASAGDDEAALSSSVALVREAVEQEGWSDWAWIRWRPVFKTLQPRADYAALLERHGRRSGPPARVDPLRGW